MKRRPNGTGIPTSTNTIRRACLIACAALAFASPAWAAVHFSLVFTETSSEAAESIASLGTSDYVGQPGDVVTLVLRGDLDPGEWLQAYGVSLEWDRDGIDELDLVSVEEPVVLLVDGAVLGHIDSGVGATIESEPGQAGRVQTLEAFTFSAPFLGGPNAVDLELARLEFVLGETVVDDGADLHLGFLAAGVDGLNGCPEVDLTPCQTGVVSIVERAVFGEASVRAAPEPHPQLLGLVGIFVLAMIRQNIR